MGRKSKLSDAKWSELEKRYLNGETARGLGREYGVSDATIRERFSTQHKKIKDVANQIVATEKALEALPISSQISAHNLAANLRSISDHLASAATYGAMTAHRLSGIAHFKVSEIDDASPIGEDSMETLKGIAVLTRMANEASTIGVNLIRANKEAIDDLNRQDMNPEATARKREVKSGMGWIYEALEADEEDEEETSG